MHLKIHTIAPSFAVYLPLPILFQIGTSESLEIYVVFDIEFEYNESILRFDKFWNFVYYNNKKRVLKTNKILLISIKSINFCDYCQRLEEFLQRRDFYTKLMSK